MPKMHKFLGKSCKNRRSTLKPPFTSDGWDFASNSLLLYTVTIFISPQL